MRGRINVRLHPDTLHSLEWKQCGITLLSDVRWGSEAALLGKSLVSNLRFAESLLLFVGSSRSRVLFGSTDRPVFQSVQNQSGITFKVGSFHIVMRVELHSFLLKLAQM